MGGEEAMVGGERSQGDGKALMISLPAHSHGEDEDYCGPGLDNTRLSMRLTAGAGTRCMSLLSSSPNLTKAPVN